MPRFCPNCGSEVDASWRVCQKCGTTLELEAPPQPIPQPYTAPAAPPYGAPSQYPAYPQTAPGMYGVKGTRARGTASLVLALVGAVCCWCCSTIAGIILGVIAMVLGAMGLKQDQDKGLAKAGLILGIMDLIAGIIFFVVLLVLLNSYYY